MAIMHAFKPYADCSDLCVAELPNGETCNEYRFSHTLDEVLEALAEVRRWQRSRDRWIEEVTDENGDLDEDECSEEDWYDGHSEYAEAIADAGIKLAAVVEKFIEGGQE